MSVVSVGSNYDEIYGQGSAQRDRAICAAAGVHVKHLDYVFGKDRVSLTGTWTPCSDHLTAGIDCQLPKGHPGAHEHKTVAIWDQLPPAAYPDWPA
jgi:hypothetical protein